MANLSKRRRAINELLTVTKLYQPQEAIELFKKMPPAKFNESVDLAVNLGVDPRKSDQAIRQRDLAIREKDAAISERDKAMNERDQATDVICALRREMDSMKRESDQAIDEKNQICAKALRQSFQQAVEINSLTVKLNQTIIQENELTRQIACLEYFKTKLCKLDSSNSEKISKLVSANTDLINQIDCLKRSAIRETDCLKEKLDMKERICTEAEHQSLQQVAEINELKRSKTCKSVL